MADVDINKFRASVVRDGSKPSSPGFIVSEGQDPVNPPGTNNYVPYSGATANVELGEYGVEAGFVTLDTTPTNTPTDQGTIFWDADDETVDIVLNGYTMKIGEDLFYPVKNQTGSTIAKGVAVRFNGTVGASGRLLIAPFIADGSVPSSRFMGVTAEEILNGEDGKVLYFGRVRGINTNAFNEGDILYASTTVAGGYQTAIPVAPNNIVQVAAVVTKSATVGTIFVRPTLGSNINKDEGVKIVSVADKNLLQYQSGTSLWENKTLAQVLGGTSAQFVKGDGSLDSTSYGTGTVTSVGLSSATSGVTIGSTPVTTSGTITLAIATASGSQNGLLSSTDWTTFNGKQPAGNYVTLDTTQTITGQKTISRVASVFNGTKQTILIDGASGESSVTLNSGASNYAYQTFAQNEVGKFEIGIVGPSGNGSFYINRTVQVGETGATIYIKKADGFVGINNITPTFQLDVSGKIYSSTEIQANSAIINTTGGYATFGSNTASAPIRIGRDALSNDIIVAASGHVLIGTTTDNLSSRLQVNGASTLSGQVTINTGLSQPLVLNGSNNQYLLISSGVGFEAMTEYYNPTADSWFTGIRATAGLGSTSSYHIYSDTYLADVFVLNTDATAKFASSVTAGSFIKSGGTSSQFLKADGSVDSTAYGTGTVTSVTASSPLFSSGGTTPNITIQQANGSQSGFLSSTDWTTFNSKVSSQWVTTGSNIYYNSGIVIVGNTTNVGDGPLQVTGTTTTYARFNSTNAGGSFIVLARDGVNIGAIGNSGNMGVGILDDFELTAQSGKNIHLKTSSGQLSVLSGGSVVIGTGLTSNGAKLQVGGTGTFSDQVTITSSNSQPLVLNNQSNEQYLYINSASNREAMTQYYNSTAGNWYTGIRTSAGIGSTSSYHIYSSTYGGDVFVCNTDGSSRFVGDVGIGVAPATNLHVQGPTVSYGQVRIRSTGDIGGETSINYARTSQTLEQGWTVGQGVAGIGDSFGFYTGGAVRLGLTTGGNVLIGTASDNGARLQIEGGAIRSVYTYNNTTATAANLVVSSGGTFERSTSSLKYKKEVRDYDKGLEVLKNMRPVYYKGKSQSDGNKQFAGLIAEEIHELGLNEFVQYANDGTPDALAYTHMIAILINSIKELKQEIDTLKN